MSKYLGTVVAILATATIGFAAGIPSSSSVYGNYVEARTADVYTGPCFANGEVGQVGQFAVLGWQVTKGAWQGVRLDGLGVVGVIRAANTLGDVYDSPYPVKAVLIVDSRANAEQRLALQSFAKRMGGDLLQDVVRVDYQPISLSFAKNNIHSMAATLVAGNEAKVQTRALTEGDEICHNEIAWYPPLTKLQHAMPAYTLANNFDGKGLGTTWSNPYKRSAFVGSFVASSN